MKNIRIFLSENFPFFLVDKFSVYLDRRVFVIKDKSWALIKLDTKLLNSQAQRAQNVESTLIQRLDNVDSTLIQRIRWLKGS